MSFPFSIKILKKHLRHEKMIGSRDHFGPARVKELTEVIELLSNYKATETVKPKNLKKNLQELSAQLKLIYP